MSAKPGGADDEVATASTFVPCSTPSTTAPTVPLLWIALRPALWPMFGPLSTRSTSWTRWWRATFTHDAGLPARYTSASATRRKEHAPFVTLFET